MSNQSNAKSKGVARKLLMAVISVIVILSMFTATTFAGILTQYEVELIVDGESTVVTTNEKEATEILSQANFEMTTNDKLDITGFTPGEGGVIVLDRKCDINVEFDKNITTYSVYGDTVKQALEEIGLTVTAEDKINYSLDSKVKDGMVISIDAAKSVSLTVDGQTTKYAIYHGTVADLISAAKVVLGKEDYTEPELTAQLEAGMEVTVFRVTYDEVTDSEKVKYGTTTQEDDTMYKGTTKVYESGVYGEDEVTYKVKYVNGEEAERTELSRKTITKPVNEIVYVGTKAYEGSADVEPNGVESYNGYHLGQVISGRYTHYCACSSCCGKSDGITSSGRRVYNGMPNPYYVACNWLPLGSVISVGGTLYTVVDHGGSGLSSVGRIDIYTPEGHAAALRGGTGSCTIEIVRLGW